LTAYKIVSVVGDVTGIFKDNFETMVPGLQACSVINAVSSLSHLIVANTDSLNQTLIIRLLLLPITAMWLLLLLTPRLVASIRRR